MKETRMITTGDVAATSTAGMAITMPWWLAQLPEMLAPFVTLVGFGIVLLTFYIKFREAQIVTRKAKELEDDD